MKAVRCRLQMTPTGWVISPVGTEALPVLSALYGSPYDELDIEEKAFMPNAEIDEAIRHIRTICTDLNIGLSVCGIASAPTLRLWYRPIESQTPMVIGLDLRYSCWTLDEEAWDNACPTVWQMMQAAFEGTAPPIRIDTSPKKEIRHGSVLISKGQAQGHFCTEWDDLDGLADTLFATNDEAFREMIPFSSHTLEPGCDWDFEVKARTFSSLMKKIDKEEAALIEHDKQEWLSILGCFRRETDEVQTNGV